MNLPIVVHGDSYLIKIEEMDKLHSAHDALLKAATRARDLLEPEVEKEPDRTIFWELVDAVRQAEGKERLFRNK